MSGRLEQIKAKIDRAKTYGIDMNVTMADVEWLIGHAERLESKLGELESDLDAWRNYWVNEVLTYNT